jgi:hypothetical protein
MHVVKAGCLTLALIFQASICVAAHASFPTANAMVRRTDSMSLTNMPDGKWHSVEIKPSSRPGTIHFYNKINPVWWFKNADAPAPPDWFKPDEKRRSLKWFLRNPLHNFSFYVIGISDKQHVRSGRYPKRIGNPNGGWNVAVAKYKWVRLPFVSYSRHGIDFYLGWRTGGNFGGKLNFNAKRPPRTGQSDSHLIESSDKTALPASRP